MGNSCCCCGWGPYAFNKDDSLTDYWDFVTAGYAAWSVPSQLTIGATAGPGSLFRSCPPPAAGWTASGVEMNARVTQGSGGQQAGIFIAGTRAFWIDWIQNKFFRATCDSAGSPGSPAVQVAGTPSGPTSLGLACGGSTVRYTINGASVLSAEEDGVSLAGLESAERVIAGVWANGAASFLDVLLGCGQVLPTPVSCAGSSFPSQWNVQFNGACTPATIQPCISFNNTAYTLSPIGYAFGPGWETYLGGIDGLSMVCTAHSIQGGGFGEGLYLQPTYNGAVAATYFLPIASVKPLGTNTLPLVWTNPLAPCTSWPGSATITPAP